MCTKFKLSILIPSEDSVVTTNGRACIIRLEFHADYEWVKNEYGKTKLNRIYQVLVKSDEFFSFCEINNYLKEFVGNIPENVD